MKKEIILKGKGFVLRPHRKGDYVSFAKNANNKKLAKNLLDSFSSPYTEKEAKKWILMNIKSQKKGTFMNFIIDIDGFAVGSMGGNFKKGQPYIVSFGYWLGEKYWGKGIVTEAIKLFTNYIFKSTKSIERIEASVYPWNEGSKKVLLKNGFKMEGILRKSRLKNGKIIDVHMFSKLRNER
ncbi:MAG: GNAT family protein [bacterium]